MSSRLFVASVLTACAMTAAACGGSEPQPESAADASHEGHAAGQARVFFVQPANGATVKSPVQFVFGNEQVNISPVPPGELTTTRADVAHYHLGVDTDCLPDGVEIPKADPWIHFGDGKDTIEMVLAPGPHKFAVQAADDLHVTIAGLCETISITVVE